MRIYSSFIFPYLMDWGLSGSLFDSYRREILADVQGAILEIGFGSGLNLPHYPSHVKKITVLDSNPGMRRLAEKRIQRSAIEVEVYQLRAEELPLPNHSFDSVISTWTLCSIEQIEKALQEIRRVLKPQGRFFFLEHGLSPDPSIQRWQNRLNPLQKKIGDGCQLIRSFNTLIPAQGFDVIELKIFPVPSLPHLIGTMYQGIATPKKLA
jgi:ubiquinone/menaquinone biosynthesis C-methylase UbiE